MAPEGRFDVLVVGGGTAGCVLAARLSEDPGRSVCLVEAGPDYGPYDEGRWPPEMLDARLIPDSHDWALSGGRSALRARILGGCSAHNACFAVWGSPEDYDEWGDAFAFETFRPYLERAETALGVRPRTDDEIGPWHRAVVDACGELGLAELADFNEPGAIEGVAAVPVNAREAVRWNAAFAYIDPVRGRPNLTIRAGASANSVDVRDGQASAALVREGDRDTRIAADTIVLAAGAYGSPAILLRSGVDLQDVGTNLVDHYGCGVFFEPNDELAAATAECERRGDHFAGQCLIKARSERCPEDTWDLHVVSWSTPSANEVHLTAFVMKPESRGAITLSEIDPESSPLVDHGFLTDPGDHDMQVLLDGLRIAQKLGACEATRALVTRETAPAGETLESYARETVRGYFHPVGTCAIGPVVDEAGRVHGFDNLHVADASVMPTIPRANTNVSVAALAELLAERIASA